MNFSMGAIVMFFIKFL